MNPNYPRGVIEIGNVNIKCLIFTINNDNTSKILSTSLTRSSGIHNCNVVDLAKASNAIRSCISSAEKKAEVSLKKISVVLEQPDFLCTKFSKHRKINGSKIHKDDIEFLLKEGKKQVMLNDEKQSIIHIFNHNYIVDGKMFIEEPINIYASHLSHEMTFITMPKNNIKKINQAFIDCDIEIERFISSSFALGVQLLNNKELQLGSILIDIGFEKTSLVFFKNFALLHSITFPLGVNHIIKDISKVCSLSLGESEKITNEIDFLFKNQNNLFDLNDNLKNIYFKDSAFRKINKSLILKVVKARLDEIFVMIKKQISIVDLNPSNKKNFYIAGGGSNFLNLEKCFSTFFEIDVKKLSQNNKKEDTDKQNQKFFSCLGALKIIRDGWETEAIPETVNKNQQKMSFFAKIFKS